ncbi:MAG: mechanosensitive ion channel family protein [Candidatus Omnitrophica bacterium]|nr:mechanosensitive ion channel family protein [Candidatus Omnitrophota bacterium]
MKNIVLMGLEIPGSIYVPVIYFLWITVFLLVKKVFYIKVVSVARKTKTKLDDVLLESLDTPLILLIFVSGIAFVENVFDFGGEGGDIIKFVDITFKATAVVAIILFLDRMFKGLIAIYSEKIPVLKTSKGVFSGLVRFLVIGIGVLILLDSFGISITPLLASLGIGSLAIALALQPTLENFFSGVQIVMDKPISLGQFIKLDTGEEGYVTKIGWRSTWIRMLPNNTVVIPNKVLVNSRVLNYYYPETELAVLVQVGVHYDSDLEQVEKVTIEVGRDVLRTVQGGVPEFEPFIRYHTFNDFSIDFSVILRAREFVDNYLIKHEFIKRLHKRYKEEGIVIPYPIRTLDWNPGSDPIRTDRKDP